MKPTYQRRKAKGAKSCKSGSTIEETKVLDVNPLATFVDFRITRAIARKAHQAGPNTTPGRKFAEKPEKKDDETHPESSPREICCGGEKERPMVGEDVGNESEWL